MTKRTLYIAWGALFVICAGLGFIPAPKGAAYWSMFLFSLVFFVPPTILLYKAIKGGDRKEVKRICTICLCSLGATIVALALNFLSVDASAAAGTAVYYILIVVSSPMICGQIWVSSLFLWGCLLTASAQELWKTRRKR